MLQRNKLSTAASTFPAAFTNAVVAVSLSKPISMIWATPAANADDPDSLAYESVQNLAVDRNKDLLE